MSARERAVDALIGSGLFLFFATLCSIGIGAIVLTVYFVGLSAKHFLLGLNPSWAIAVFYVFLCLWSFVGGIRHLRKKRLLNAFLSIAMIPMIAFVWLGGPHSLLRDNAPFAWPWFLVILIPNDSVVTRLEFMLGAFAVSLSVGVNSGLLGTGTLAHVAKDSVFVALICLFAIYFHRKHHKRTGLPGAADLTGA
jgi:hypothetical protein